MEEKIKSLSKNNTWKLVPKLENEFFVDCKQIYSIKEEISYKQPLRFKARLVGKGKPSIDYNKIFSHVVKYIIIRVILALVAQYDLELEQMDTKTIMLHCDLDETIYICQPRASLIIKSLYMFVY